jgi:predicted metalloprotease
MVAAMRWDPGHQSRDLIDRRGARAPRGGGGGAPVGLLLSLALRTKYGWILLVLAGAYYLFFTVEEAPRDPAMSGGERAAVAAPDELLARFVGFVLDDLQDTWTGIFRREGWTYERAKLVLFTGATASACGLGEAAMGPFYCPGDRQVYIDLGFYKELRGRLGAPGDFAQAYVIGHEIGHHVQELLAASGVTPRRGRERGAEGDAVRVELQADCFAGIWAHAAAQRGILEVGDVEEALAAAAAIGDDALQRAGSGRVRPESFSHGTSEQRARWLRTGLERGEVAACDTFAARSL